MAPFFRSDSQARLLVMLFLSSTHEFTILELAERAGLAYATAHREVGKLLEAGVLAEHRVGQARLVRPDPDSPLHGPLLSLLLVAFGAVPLLQREFREVAGVVYAALFGPYADQLLGAAGPPPREVDLLVVGRLDSADVHAACDHVGLAVGRTVTPTMLSLDEWQEDSEFAERVSAGGLVPIFGRLPELGARAGEPGLSAS